MIELAIPAGRLENAITAYRHGADAVYFGLKDFSARKGAGNFSEEDLSKISRMAHENGRKYYLTINTLIDDDKLPELYEALKTVSAYRPDGIIVQDLGAASLMRRDFPELPLHGSTQLAVHTANGVKELKRLGFERAVLSRELSLSEIEAIRRECPDIELKVFIHGALCYGFSGLCMASHIITGRSANEGECAQICRTYFRDKSTGRNVFPFSLKDMEAGALIKELERIGIDSVKVEGRLKGNEYVAAVTDYYRALIDGKSTEGLEHPLAVSFRRMQSEGYLNYSGPGHKKLTTGDYTGHLGECIGKAAGSDRAAIDIETEKTISDRDGLMILLPDGPYRFASKIIRKTSYGYVVRNTDGKNIPSGTDIYMISDSSLNQKTPSTDIPQSKASIDLSITIGDSMITVTSPISVKSYEVQIEEGRTGCFEDAIRKIFSQSGESSFQPRAAAIENNSGFTNPYINAKDMKRIRREYLSSLVPMEDKRTYRITTSGISTELLPERSVISDGPLPWNLSGTEAEGYTYYSFPPVTFDEEKLFREMEEAIKGKKNVRIGINNIAQIAFAREHRDAEYFADIYLYMSNREAAELAKKSIPNLIGGYLWIEREKYEEPWPFTPTPASGFVPPLFISRACYRHDGLGLSCSGCSRSHRFGLTQNGTDYTAYVRDCMTAVVRDR